MTYDDAIEQIESELDHAADLACDWIIRECQLSEDGQHAAMQKVYRELDRVRAHWLAQIELIWAKADAAPTVH